MAGPGVPSRLRRPRRLGRMLEEYAAFPLFRTVGIDSSFYAPPTEEILAAYAEHLPPGSPA